MWWYFSSSASLKIDASLLARRTTEYENMPTSWGSWSLAFEFIINLNRELSLCWYPGRILLFKVLMVRWCFHICCKETCTHDDDHDRWFFSLTMLSKQKVFDIFQMYFCWIMTNGHVLSSTQKQIFDRRETNKYETNHHVYKRFLGKWYCITNRSSTNKKWLAKEKSI